jgi:hypothetical protein
MVKLAANPVRAYGRLAQALAGDFSASRPSIDCSGDGGTCTGNRGTRNRRTSHDELMFLALQPRRISGTPTGNSALAAVAVGG